MSLPLYSEVQERVPISELVRELFRKMNDLLLTQVEITKTELKVESRKLVAAVVFGFIALILGTLFITFLGVSLILLLTPSLGLVWASVVTTVAYLVLTGLAAFFAFREIRKNSATIDIN
jgi:uncharacterized membrane protein YqjE